MRFKIPSALRASCHRNGGEYITGFNWNSNEVLEITIGKSKSHCLEKASAACILPTLYRLKALKPQINVKYNDSFIGTYDCVQGMLINEPSNSTAPANPRPRVVN